MMVNFVLKTVPEYAQSRNIPLMKRTFPLYGIAIENPFKYDG